MGMFASTLGGTLAIVLQDLRRAKLHTLTGTSLVMEGFSDLRAILSTHRCRRCLFGSLHIVIGGESEQNILHVFPT